MNFRKMLLLLAVAGGVLLTGLATAAMPLKAEPEPPGSITYLSVSGLAFAPVSPNIAYQKDTTRQLLTLTGPVQAGSLFVAPLSLPNRGRLSGITIFGEDFDAQGQVRVRLLRCNHGQPRCTALADVSSTDGYAGGRFDTGRIAIANEGVDNSLFSYLLELELTARFNSGLGAVRLDLLEPGSSPLPAGNVERWSLDGAVTSFTLPNLDWVSARVCTDDLSHLDNPTHYPMLVVDGRVTALSSNTCVTVWGRAIEVRRRLNTGPSSGTYQFLP